MSVSSLDSHIKILGNKSYFLKLNSEPQRTPLRIWDKSQSTEPVSSLENE